MALASVNLAARKRPNGVSGRFWESGRHLRRWREEAKGRETKMTRGIQMHLSGRVNPLVCLFSFHLGHWTQKEETGGWGSVAEREGTCRCVHTCRMVSVCLWKHEYACLHKRWRKLVHTDGGILLSRCCLTSGRSDVQPPLRASQYVCGLLLQAKRWIIWRLSSVSHRLGWFVQNFYCCIAD